MVVFFDFIVGFLLLVFPVFGVLFVLGLSVVSMVVCMVGIVRCLVWCLRVFLLVSICCLWSC